MSTEEQRRGWRERKRAERVRKGLAIAPLESLAARAADLPDPPSREVLFRLLGVRSRDGSAQAIRLLLEEYRRDDVEQPSGSADVAPPPSG